MPFSWLAATTYNLSSSITEANEPFWREYVSIYTCIWSQIIDNSTNNNDKLQSWSPPISLLCNLQNQNSSERFAKDFRQSYMSSLIWKCLILPWVNTIHIRYDMYDWQKSFVNCLEEFWFKRSCSPLTVKSIMVKVLSDVQCNEPILSFLPSSSFRYFCSLDYLW